jgi:S-adenosylmethionine-diacylglycerol 3-amino-3-carboxypropyl transferase
MQTCFPSHSDLAFAQVREDWRIEWQVLDRLSQNQSRPLRVLLVASGGCTALSLLAHPSVGAVDAVDANAAQLALLQLRATALAYLTPADQWVLLATGGETLATERTHLYNQIRNYLPAPTRDFWDQRPAEIQMGVNQVGRFEQLFRELAQAFCDQGLDPLPRPEEAIASPHWRPIFDQVFARPKLIQTFGEAAVSYSMDRSFGEHFADVFARALSKFSPQENYFLTQVWADCYPAGAEHRPLYLQPEMLPRLRSHLSQLQLNPGRFTEQLQRLAVNNRYDLIQFSNLSDWMPIPALQAMLATISQSLQPGGAVIGRRLNGDHHLASQMAAFFTVDQAWNDALLESDRSFFYSEVVVGWR